MNIRKLFVVASALLGFAASAFAQSATAVKVVGTASVTLADGSTQPLVQGAKVPQGATVNTGADGDVYLETHKGYVTSIKKDSSVTVAEVSVKDGKENTFLDLKSGNLVAKLDPKKKAVNNYQVRTPKGVAAARGTTFTVGFRGTTYTIAVIEGQVSIAPATATGAFLTQMQISSGMFNAANTVSAGQVVSANDSAAGFFAGAGAQNMANLINADSAEIRELLALAVATVAVAAENNIGGTTAADVKAVADAVIKAVPSAATAVAAAVAVSAPTQSQTIVTSVQQNAPAQSSAVQSVINQVTPNTTPGTTVTVPDAPPVTTPQPIDPSTVSRS